MRIFSFLSSWFSRDQEARSSIQAVAVAEDQAILRDLRAGNERTFATLVGDLTAPLTAYAMSFVNDIDVAKDIVQDAFAKLWDERLTVTPSSTLERYLFGAVRFRALHVLRRRRLEDRHTGTITHLETQNVPRLPDEDIERSDLYQSALRAVEDLPPRARTVFALRWGEGLSYAAIAAQLGISVKGVEIQLTRALKFLRQRLDR